MSFNPLKSETVSHRDNPAAPLAGRLGAAVIDATVVATLAIVVSLCAHLVVIFLPESVGAHEAIVLFPLAGLIAAAYFVYSWGYEGATLGQRMLGLRVGRAESGGAERLGLRRALLRLAGAILGLLALDLLIAVLRSDRRALHDVVAGSFVVADREVVTPRVARPLPQIRKGRKYA